MPLYNDNIKNYFRPFATAHSLEKKRPLSEEDQEQPTSKRSPLTSSRENQTCTPEEDIALPANEASGNASGGDKSLHSSRRSQSTSSRPAKPDQTPPISSSDEPIAHDVTEAAALVPLQDETASRTPAFSSSQTILTSSQRIVKNGEVMIRNSDEESDSSLEDLDDLIALNPSWRSPSPLACSLDDSFSNIQAGKNAESVKKQRTGKAHVEKSASPHRSTLPVIPKPYRFSLDSLAKERRQHEAGKDSVAQALSLMESYDQRKASSNERFRVLGQSSTLEADLITRLVRTEEDDDDVSRLQTAIQRTEALQYSQSWSFFEDHPDRPPFHREVFPAIKDQRLRPVVNESVSRQQAFLSGYVGEYANKASLPEELLLWIMDEICFETRDDLRYSYTDTLKHATVQLSPLITLEHIDTLFRKLGATATATDIETPVVPRAVLSQNIDHVSRPCLLSILDLLGSIAGSLATECRTHIFCLLCRLALDQSIVKDFPAINAIGNLFSKLADLYREEENDLEVRGRAIVDILQTNTIPYQLQTMLNTTYHSIKDASLQLLLLQTIPPLPQLVLFRQRLALSFFFLDPHYFSAQPEDLIDFRSIAIHLETPKYTINSATNYSALAASIDILSIAVGCGNPLSPESAKEDKAAFDRDVDILATKIRAMFTQIIDTSASHMKRTEAKEILEAFHSRLLFAVRTRPPPKKKVFGNEVAKQVGDMDAFVVRRKGDDEFGIPNG